MKITNMKNKISGLVLGVALFSSFALTSSSFADVNKNLPLVPTASQGQLLSVSGWNNIKESIVLLAERTKNITSAFLLLKTDSGTNAEINIQSGEKNKWAIYQDENSETLHFWNIENIFSLLKNGNAEFSGGVKIGYDESLCSGVKEGVMRYNTILKNFEGCNGTSWLSLTEGDSNQAVFNE